jgi:flavodoxin
MLCFDVSKNNIFNSCPFGVMKACILYFSRTGNTKKLAETIAEALETDAVFDITSTEPTIVNDYEVIVFGTPVHGFSPSVESVSYVGKLPQGNGKQAALFCTCRLWTGRTFSKLKSELKKKGYKTVTCASAKAKEFTAEDFIKPTKNIVNALKR